MVKHEITGYYGNNNFGDDLFVEILKGYLEINNKEVLVDLYDSNFIARVYGKLNRLSSVESVTLGGGSILGTSGKFGVRNLEAYLKNFFKYKYCAIGVGIENVDFIPDEFIKKFDLLGIRSRKDYEILKNKNPNIFYSSDLAYSYKLIFGDNIVEKKNINEIGIVLTDTGLIGGDIENAVAIKKMISELESFFKDHFFNIYCFQPKRDADNEVVLTFTKYLDDASIKYKVFNHSDVHQTINHLQRNKFVVSDRLHAGILCHILRIPFLLSTHHQKCIDYLDDINYFINEFNLESVNKENFINAINWCNSNMNTLDFHEENSKKSLQNWIQLIN